jgi:hypothetical protein
VAHFQAEKLKIEAEAAACYGRAGHWFLYKFCEFISLRLCRFDVRNVSDIPATHPFFIAAAPPVSD